MPVSRLRFNPSTGKWEEAAADDGAVRPEVPLTGASANDGTQLGLDPTKTYGATDIAGAAAANRVLTGQFGLTAQEQQNISDEAVRRLKQTTAPLYEGLTQNAIARGVFRGGPLTSAYGTVATDFAEQVGATERGIASDAALRAAQEREQAITTLANIGAQQESAAATQRGLNISQEAQDLAKQVQLGQLTIEQLRQSLEGEIQRGNLSIAQKDQILREAELYGAGEGGTTLESQKLAEQTRAAKAEEDRLKAELMGYAAPETGLTEAEVRGRLGLTTEGTGAGRIKMREAGYTLDEATGLWSTKGASTLAGRQFGLQEKATVAQFTGKFGEADTLEKVAQDAKLALDDALMTGELVIRDAEGNPVLDKATGKPLTLLTMASKELALKRAELTGKTAEGDETMDQKRLDLEAEIQRGQIALQQDAQNFGQKITEADLTGYYKRFGMADWADFQASYGSALGSPGYNGKFDLNDDKKIDLEDFADFAAIVNGQAAQTLKGQAFAEDVARNDFQEAVTKAGLTGTYAGDQIVAEKQRLHDNWIEESKIFVDAAPVTFTGPDYMAGYGKSKGQAGYRAEFDFNSDGKIDFTDFTGAASEGRIEIVSGKSPGDADFVGIFKPKGKQTVIAAQLGLDEKKFGEGVREFNATFGQQISEFKSNFSGYMFDANGQPVQAYHQQPDGTWKAEQLTRAEREQWDRQVDQLDDMFSGPSNVWALQRKDANGRVVETAVGTREELATKGAFDAGGSPKTGWNFADGQALIDLGLDSQGQTLTPIERLVKAVGGDLKGAMKLNSENQIAFVKSIMSVLFQPVQPTYGPQSQIPGLIGSAFSALGTVGAG